MLAEGQQHLTEECASWRRHAGWTQTLAEAPGCMGQSRRHTAPDGSHESLPAHRGKPGACSQADVGWRNLGAAFCCSPGTAQGRKVREMCSAPAEHTDNKGCGGFKGRAQPVCFHISACFTAQAGNRAQGTWSPPRTRWFSLCRTLPNTNTTKDWTSCNLLKSWHDL